MRPILVLLAPLAALALLAPVAHAGAACPALPEVECSADVDSDLVTTAHVGVKDYDVSADAQAPQGPGSPIAGAAIEQYGDGEETVVSASADCWHLAEGGCFPKTFAGTHVQTADHDFRAGSDSPNRGGSSSYEGKVAGHTFAYRMGTFYDRQIQFGYIGLWIDGEGGEQFGAFPTFFL